MITFNDGTAAFDAAIASGRLSASPTSPVYAGHFMYMGTTEDGDTFKHRDTRRYLPFLPGDWEAELGRERDRRDEDDDADLQQDAE